MTSSSHQKPEAIQRGARMLRTALGPAIARFLEDDGIVEVMLNPDGRIWIDRLSQGLSDTGERLSAADGERIVRLVAHHVGAEVHARSPRVSAELPETGERFEGLLPPVVAAPAFAIRKPAVAVFTLDDYVAAGIMSADQAVTLREAVASRANILVAGGTSTGKTTLTNALLAEVAKTQDRVVIIEDTRELQCAAPNLVSMRTKEGVVTLSDLVRSSLRLRPDRIPIGEVRGSEALDLLKAWGTGHPGGVGTIHAGTGIGALRRLEQRRVLLVWNRLIMPNGRSIVLERQPGADTQGYAGLEDGVDYHWWDLAKAATLSTLLGVGAELATDDNDRLLRAIRGGAQDTVNQAGQQIIQRQLQVAPTLTIRPGYPVRVIVTRDIVFEPYRS